MVPDWLAIIPDLPIRALCDLAIQLKLARNDCLGEITFADEIWDDVNVFDCVWSKEKNRVTQARLFFPKRTLHIGKNISTPNLGPMRQRRRTRVRIHRRAMTDDEESAVGFRNH